MPTIDEKRVYSGTEGTTPVYLAAELGVVVASVSGDIVGEFSVDHRCTALDVAARGDLLAVATDEDVLLGSDHAPAGFGPAEAVGIHDGGVVAAAADGRVARYDGDWAEVGTVEEPRTVDGPLVAAADGVHRVVGDDLQAVGLADARDVAGSGVPLAATADGLYYLGNGWMDAVEGGHTVVDSDGERAHAIAEDGTVRAGAPTGDWHACSLPATDVIGFGYADEQVVAATDDGDLLVHGASEGGDDGWRSRALGVRGVRGLAVP